MNRALAIIVIGGVLLTAGLVMPDTIERSEKKCIEHNPYGAGCMQFGEVGYDESNDFKIPTIVSGVSVLSVGIALRGGVDGR